MTQGIGLLNEKQYIEFPNLISTILSVILDDFEQTMPAGGGREPPVIIGIIRKLPHD